MNKFIIVAALLLVGIAAQTEICSASADGYVRQQNVCQKCHRSCKTCTVANSSSGCASCWSNQVLTAGVCGCTSTGLSFVGKSANSATVECFSTARVASDCIPGTVIDTAQTDSGCKWCADECETCQGSVTGVSCADGTSGCWGTTISGATSACSYTSLTAWIAGHDVSYDHSTSTVANVEGYYYDSTSFQLHPCAAGCATCSSAGACTTCDSSNGYSLSSGGAACECAAGKWEDSATQVCAACPSACTACTSATVCTTCASGYSFSSTNSSECVSAAAAAAAGAGAGTGTAAAPSAGAAIAALPASDLTAANAASNIAAPSTCDSSLTGCTACSATASTECTACASAYYQSLDTATKKCVCMANHARGTNGGCGVQCLTACGTGQTCMLDGTAGKCSSSAAAAAAPAANSMLITAATMIAAIILA